jgi:hypothetical protein
VAQLTIYMPDEVAEQVRKAARRAHLSVSSYLTELASRSLKPRQWPEGFAGLYGSWEGDFPEPEDAPPTEPEAL